MLGGTKARLVLKRPSCETPDSQKSHGYFAKWRMLRCRSNAGTSRSWQMELALSDFLAPRATTQARLGLMPAALEGPCVRKNCSGSSIYARPLANAVLLTLLSQPVQSNLVVG